MGSFKKSCLTNCDKILKCANLEMTDGQRDFQCVMWKILPLVNERSAYFEK